MGLNTKKMEQAMTVGMTSSDVADLVKMGKRIRVEAYSVSDSVEKKVKDILAAYLEGTGCEEIHASLYTVIKELLINAVKANFKNIYFENYKTAKCDKSLLSYEIALKVFNLELTRDKAVHFEKRARAENVSARVVFSNAGGNLSVDIANPVAMTDIEIANVQKKLSFAKQCTNISEYFLTEEEDPHKEGAGLGLILVVMVVKSLGLHQADFVIESRSAGTSARFTVPLNAETMKCYVAASGR